MDTILKAITKYQIKQQLLVVVVSNKCTQITANSLFAIYVVLYSMNGFYGRRNVFIHATPICHHIEHSVLVTRKVNILGKVVYFLNLSQMTAGRQGELDSVTDLLNMNVIANSSVCLLYHY